MDSKNIYIAYQHYSNSVKWEMHGESEWLYLGAGKEFRENQAAEFIDTFFSENNLFLITDRHDSSLIRKYEAIAKVMKCIAKGSPVLSNEDFSRILEFNRIGVVRMGQRNI